MKDEMLEEARLNYKLLRNQKDRINQILDCNKEGLERNLKCKNIKANKVDKPTVTKKVETTRIQNEKGDTNMNFEEALQVQNEFTNMADLSIKDYKDYQQVRTTSMQEAYANTYGIGRTANRMVQEGKGESVLTSHDSSLIKPSFTKPLLITQDAPQSLRSVMQVTALEDLKSTVLLDYVSKDTAEYEGLNEVDLKAYELDFQYHGERALAEVSDTIVYCDDPGYLDEAIKTTLMNVMIDKEMRLITGEVPVQPGTRDNSYMNLYRADDPIKQVSGSDILTAITNATKDLHRAVRPLATLAINNDDYITLMKELATIGLGSIDLKAYFGISGIIVNPYIKSPIVGNFKGLHANYTFEQFEFYQKKPKQGICTFVLSYIYDIQFIPMLFRIAKVG